MRCYNCANWEKSSYMDATCYNMPRCLMNDVNRRIKYNEFKYEVGKKILFKGEKRYYYRNILTWKRIDEPEESSFA